MSEIGLNNRRKQAVTYFEQGYNCSQAVFMTYSYMYGIETETAAKLTGYFV
jgi:hypothetical protein